MSPQSPVGLLIIKPGKPPGAKAIHSTCQACGCEFQAPRSLWVLVPDPRDGAFYKMDCPMSGCGHVITVSQAKADG